jgi:LuxR family maltose regulon positive regulatory protein
MMSAMRTSAGRALVVTTKLVVPSLRPETIVRERVIGLLAEAAERPLTVVSAPAGFGKTTAVVTWLETVGARRAWVSLDALDNDPRRFCAHLLAALDGALPGAMDDALGRLRGGSDLLDTVVPSAVSALAELARERLVVVLDDYHEIENRDCHALLNALIDALPAPLRIVVCSRTAPPLRLDSRRAAGAVAELGPCELAFRDGESERLLNGSLRLALEPPVIDAIESRVEGWAAGLALVASTLTEEKERTRYLRALSARHPKVNGPNVAAYLVEEVLDRTDARLREFLRYTSILSRLSGPLCEAVLEDPAGPELLDEVRRSNLFVTVLDDAWLRYHHLFAELLERELRARSPQLVPVLHRRASAWFAANDLPEDAIRHSSAAGDGERAAELLRDGWGALVAEGRYVTVRRLIAHLPAGRGELAGFCDALDAMCMSLEGVDLRFVMQRLEALEPLRESPGVAPIVDMMRVSPYYGDVGRAVEDGWTAWERYPDMQTRSMLAGQLATVLWFAGDRDGVRDLLEPLLGAIGTAEGRMWALAALALSAADEDDVDAAERYARDAAEVAETHEEVIALGRHLAYVALAEALRLRGDLHEAGERLEQAALLTGKLPGSVYHALTLVVDAQLALTRNDSGRARARAAAARAIIDRYPDVGGLADRLTRVEQGLQPRESSDLRGTGPTAAELRVLAWLPSDLTLEQIARELYLSVNTVKSHRRRLYQRLGVTSREDAVAAARIRGLL